jgi:ribose/xylose/arabinose/galactoside ABC-type transport system permease subunit
LRGWEAKPSAIPVQIVFTVLAFVVFHFSLGASRFDRQLYGFGGNREAMRASGSTPDPSS